MRYLNPLSFSACFELLRFLFIHCQPTICTLLCSVNNPPSKAQMVPKKRKRKAEPDPAYSGSHRELQNAIGPVSACTQAEGASVQPFRFLALPNDVRDMVYQILEDDSFSPACSAVIEHESVAELKRNQTIARRSHIGHLVRHSLLLTCRQINQEWKYHFLHSGRLVICNGPWEHAGDDPSNWISRYYYGGYCRGPFHKEGSVGPFSRSIGDLSKLGCLEFVLPILNTRGLLQKLRLQSSGMKYPHSFGKCLVDTLLTTLYTNTYRESFRYWVAHKAKTPHRRLRVEMFCEGGLIWFRPIFHMVLLFEVADTKVYATAMRQTWNKCIKTALAPLDEANVNLYPTSPSCTHYGNLRLVFTKDGRKWKPDPVSSEVDNSIPGVTIIDLCPTSMPAAT